MSGETRQSVSGWTVDTLRQYLDTQHDDLRVMLAERYATQTKAIDAAFLAQQMAVQAALLATKEAVGKAEIAMEKRLDGMNEFRDQLNDQARTFMPRAESLGRHDGTNDKLDAMDKRLGERIEAWKIDSNKAHDVLDEKIAALSSRIDRRDGERAGSTANTRNIYAFVGFVGAVLTIVVLLANGFI